MVHYRARMSRRATRRYSRTDTADLLRGWLDRVHIHPRRASLHAVVLSLGLSVAVISAVTGRSVVSPASLTDTPVDVAQDSTDDASPVVEVSPQITTYVVEPGDTLLSIAERFGLSMATIAVANSLPDPNLIQVGQELTLLPMTGVLHAV